MSTLLGKLHDRFWARILLFLLCPIALVILVYIIPALAPYWMVCGTTVFALLMLYLTTFRRNDLPIVLTIMPSAGGPLLANWYAQAQYPPAQEALASGGDTLVALAFFWASFVALFVYLASKPLTSSMDKVGWVVAILILLLVVFTGQQFATATLYDGPTIFGDHQTPSVTWLLLARVLITLYGTLEAIRS